MERDLVNADHESEAGPVSTDDEGKDGEFGHNTAVRSSSTTAAAGDGNVPADADEDDPSPESPLEGRVEERQEKIIQAAVQAVIALERSESYSGLLPHPEHWDKFDPETRERILRMSEAYTTDESARRDRIVDAEISEAPKGRRNALLIMLVSLVCAAISVFVFSNNVAAGIFLAVPLVAVVRDFIQGRRSQSDD